jgi:hypothetical protein
MSEQINYEEEILKPYLPALIAIGVDFQREDVTEAIELCNEGLEEAVMAFIVWWRNRGKSLQYPSAGFIQALYDQWKPKANVWDEEILNLPELQPRYHKWLEKATQLWGKDFIDATIIDFGIKINGIEYITLSNNETFSLDYIYRLGFEGFKKVMDNCLLELKLAKNRHDYLQEQLAQLQQK